MTESSLSVQEKPAETFLSIPVPPEMITRFKSYLDITIADINDNKALKLVHEKRMELVKARTAVDKARKSLNEDAKKKIDENNATAKAIIAELAPIEEHLSAEENRVEQAREAARVEAANKVYRERVARMKEIGYEMPEPAVRSMSAEAFEQTMIVAQAQAIERKRQEEMAKELEAERLRLEAERQAEFEKQEAERIRLQEIEAERQRAEQERLDAERAAAEEERLRKQAEEDAARKLEAEKLEQERLEFERQRAEAQAEIDRQREEMAAAIREQEEKARQAEEEKRQAEERERQRIAAEQAEKDRQEAERLRLEREAEEQRLAAEKAEEERQRLEAMKPDIQKLLDYVTKLEGVTLPEVGVAAVTLKVDVANILVDAIDSMRSVLQSNARE